MNIAHLQKQARERFRKILNDGNMFDPELIAYGVEPPIDPLDALDSEIRIAVEAVVEEMEKGVSLLIQAHPELKNAIASTLYFSKLSPREVNENT